MFEKRTKRIVSVEEAQKLQAEGKAKIIAFAPDGQVEISEKAPSVRKEKPTMSKAELPEEVKPGHTVVLRFQRRKKGDDGKSKRVTIQKFKISRSRLTGRFPKLFVRPTGMPLLPFGMHHVDMSFLDARGELNYDEDLAEPINPDTGEAEWSWEFETLLVQGLWSQMIEVASRFWKFVFTRQHLVFMALGGAAGLSLALGLASMFHMGGGMSISWTDHLPG